ncbi:hypothetical protein D9M72_403190 [compost metagenome]
MDGKPVALRVLQAVGNVVPVGGLVGGGDAVLLGLDAEGHAVVDHVGHRAGFLGDQLRQRLAGVFVVQRHGNAGLFLDGADLCRPVGPFGRAVVADRGLGGHALAERGGA